MTSSTTSGSRNRTASRNAGDGTGMRGRRRRRVADRVLADRIFEIPEGE